MHVNIKCINYVTLNLFSFKIYILTHCNYEVKEKHEEKLDK